MKTKDVYPFAKDRCETPVSGDDVDSLSAGRKRSEAAHDLASRLRPSFFGDTVAKRLAARQIDEAVEPLVTMLEELVSGATDSDHLVLVHVSSIQKALEPWRQK